MEEEEEEEGKEEEEEGQEQGEQEKEKGDAFSPLGRRIGRAVPTAQTIWGYC